MEDTGFSRRDLDLLRSPLSESGFRNVYVGEKSHDGPIRFVAKVKTGGRLRTLPGARGPEPHRIAGYVLAWYAATYGPAWRDVLRARKRNAIKIWQGVKGGRYFARVYFRGKPVEVVRGDGRRGSWKGRAAAVTAAKKFAEKLVGGPLEGNTELYRVGAAPCPT